MLKTYDSYEKGLVSELKITQLFAPEVNTTCMFRLTLYLNLTYSLFTKVFLSESIWKIIQRSL